MDPVNQVFNMPAEPDENPRHSALGGGYYYSPRWWTAGILFRDDDDFPHYFNMRHATQPPPYHLLPYLRIPDLTICSSSSGLVLFNDAHTDLIYYIFNPFMPYPISYMPIVRPPSRHQTNTPAVLAVDVSNLTAPVFYIICALRVRPGIYSFDAYLSSRGAPWVSYDRLNLQGRSIVRNSGVSCGRLAYWLTEAPRSIIRFDVLAEGGNPVKFLDLPNSVSSRTRMQLGRVYGNSLGLVVVDLVSSRVELHVLWDDDRFRLNASKRVVIREDGKWEAGSVFVFKTMPWPIRFESFRAEVLLWVDRRVVMWDYNQNDPQLSRIFNFLPETSYRVAEGVPHVCSSLFPRNFFLNRQGVSMVPPVTRRS